MGEVYRADDLTLDQPVALKFLPEGIAGSDARLAQFHNELRVARQVSHKNVCPALRPRRRRRPPLPDDGVRRRRGSGVAAAADRADSGRQGDPDGAAAVRGGVGGARARRAASRPEAGQRDDRRRRQRPRHRLRDCDGDGRRGSGAGGHAAVHGAGAARGPAGVDEERHLRARVDPVRDLHGPARLRREDARRPETAARHGDGHDALVDREAISIRRSSA